MRKHLVATFLIAVAIGPASALALGLGAKVGPVGVGAQVGINKSGVSAGIGAEADGVGGVKGGTSLGKGGSSLGVGGNLGRTSGGMSVGSGSKAGSSSGGGTATGSGAASGGSAAGSGTRPSSGGATAGSRSPGAGGANTITRIAPATSARASIVLPRILWPLKKKRAGQERGEWGYPIRLPLTIAAVPGTPNTVVRACQRAIASAASPLGAVRVRAASAGSLLRHRNGALTAPLAVSIDYAGQDGIQVRRARIRCRLDSSGRVIAVI
ncbi:helicase [Sinorhizobium fredii]|uniref:helicase n=1 Tax=Rhizobium fredii TaxID=380 RepID=UPI0035126220